MAQANRPFVEQLTLLVRFLKLPTQDVVVGVQISAVHYSAFSADEEGFFQNTLGQAESLFNSHSQKFQQEKGKILAVSWIRKQYGEVLELILAKLESLAMSSPQALLEFTIIAEQSADAIRAVPHLIPWFIRYGEISDLTSPAIQEKLGHRFYRDYVARLPSDELNEFLVSESSEERIMARNKFQLETET